MLRPELVAWVMDDEGFYDFAYSDNTQHSIGWGTVAKRPDEKISYGKAYLRLVQELEDASRWAYAVIPGFYGLDEVRQDAFVNMAFNLGQHGLYGFRRMRLAIEAEDWEKAAEEALDSRWHKQVKGRAERIAEAIKTGTYPWE